MSTDRASYIIHYYTNHLSSTDLVKFYYALKGRGKSIGLLEQTNSQYLARSVIQVPAKNLALVKYFLQKWGCKYKSVTVVPKAKATHRLFVFDSSKLRGSAKVRFLYALKGRGKAKGVIETLKGRYVARAVVLVPVKNYFELVRFFRSWNCDFEVKEVRVNV